MSPGHPPAGSKLCPWIPEQTPNSALLLESVAAAQHVCLDWHLMPTLAVVYAARAVVKLRVAGMYLPRVTKVLTTRRTCWSCSSSSCASRSARADRSQAACCNSSNTTGHSSCKMAGTCFYIDSGTKMLTIRPQHMTRNGHKHSFLSERPCEINSLVKLTSFCW